MTPVLALNLPSPILALPAAGAGLLGVVALRADGSRLSRFLIVGGWSLFTLTTVSAEFPHQLRPVSLVLAMGGVALDAALRGRNPARGRGRRIAAPSRLLLVYAFFVLIGCLASPYGPKNLIRWVEGVSIVGAGFYAVAVGLAMPVLVGTFWACAANVVLSVLSRRQELTPDGYPDGRLAGYMAPNHLAFTAAEVLIGVMWVWSRHPSVRVPLFGRRSLRPALAGLALVSVYALLATRSRTGLIAFIFAAGLAWFVTPSHPGHRMRALLWSGIALLAVLPLSSATLGHYLNRDHSSQGLTSLTGRTNFWPLVFQFIKARPIIGWGVNVFYTPQGQKFQAIIPGLGQAHNAYLEAGLQSGVVGMLAWGASMIGVMIGSFRLPAVAPTKRLLVAATVLIFISALTESNAAWFGDMFLVYVLTCALYSDELQAPFRPRLRARWTRPATVPAGTGVR